MGPPLWSQTLDAYDCIMVPIQDWIDRIQGCDSRDVTRFTAPRTFLKLRKRHALKNAVDKKTINCSPPIQAPKTPQQFQSQLLCQDASFTFGYDDLRRQILILSLRL